MATGAKRAQVQIKSLHPGLSVGHIQQDRINLTLRIHFFLLYQVLSELSLEKEPRKHSTEANNPYYQL